MMECGYCNVRFIQYVTVCVKFKNNIDLRALSCFFIASPPTFRTPFVSYDKKFKEQRNSKVLKEENIFPKVTKQILFRWNFRLSFLQLHV